MLHQDKKLYSKRYLYVFCSNGLIIYRRRKRGTRYSKSDDRFHANYKARGGCKRGIYEAVVKIKLAGLLSERGLWPGQGFCGVDLENYLKVGESSDSNETGYSLPTL